MHCLNQLAETGKDDLPWQTASPNLDLMTDLLLPETTHPLPWHSPFESNPWQDPRFSEFGESGVLNSYDKDQVFKQVSSLSAATFFASAIEAYTKLCYIKDERQKGVLICVITINVISCHAHTNMALGLLPVFENCWGRRMNYARWAEWMSLVFLLMFVMHSLDCESRREMLWSIVAQGISVVTGFFASISCVLSPDNLCTTILDMTHLDNPYYITAVVMLTLSTIAYCDIFRVLYDRAVRPIDDVNRAQAMLLICWCTFTWTAFVAVYLMGVLNLEFFNERVESIMYTVVDVLAKFMCVGGGGGGRGCGC